MKSVKKANISGSDKVLIRADLDVPIENGEIQDTYRLDCLVPTLKYLKSKNAKIVLMGHIDRPGGEYSDELSTKNLEPYFDKVLGEGKYNLLENIRFDSREEENSEEYAREIISNISPAIYVNEAFGVSHRKHTSMVTIPKLLPSYAGLRLIEEVNTLQKVLDSPDRPLVSIVGGAKVETKRPVIDKLLEISDEVLIGGKIGLNWSGGSSKNLHLPTEYIDRKDIGHVTISNFIEIIKTAKTIIWSGPLGMFEDPRYINGTKQIAEAVINSGAYSIVGGGDTTRAIKEVGVLDEIDFVSTGGGAMLNFLENETLPALEVLKS